MTDSTARDRASNGGNAGGGEVGVLLGRAELLLATAEAVRTESTGERSEIAWREAIARLQHAAAAFRTAVAASALALPEDARRERSRVAAETEALRAEGEALRAEIELLRAERDLSLALVLDAGSAVTRHLAMWHQLHGETRGRSAPSTDTVTEASSSGGNHASDIDSPVGASFAQLAGLSNTAVKAGGSIATSHITLTVSGLPGLVSLLALERALTQLPSLRRCSVGSLQEGVASVELALYPPATPLLVAAEMLCLPDLGLVVTSVDEARIVAQLT